jgi:hypothetical protein
MGLLDFACITLNGTSVVALSMAQSTKDYSNNYDNNVAALILVESKQPASLKDLTSVSVTSLWSHNLTSRFRYSNMQFVCHVDPGTGVFSAVHSNSGASPSDRTLPLIPTGGFQYDPRTGSWTELKASADYQWKGDPTTSFTIFSWPNTSTLYLAAIGNSSSINVGMLTPGAGNQTGPIFVNSFNWTLVILLVER